MTNRFIAHSLSFLRGRGMSANGSAHKSVHLLTLFPVARSYAIACAPMTLSIPCRFPFSISLLPPPRRHGPEQQRQRKRDCKAAVQGLAATNERLVSARVGVLGMVAAAVPFVMFEVFLWRCTRLIWSCAGAGDCDPPTSALSPVMPCASISVAAATAWTIAMASALSTLTMAPAPWRWR